jgi:Tfp pilus assembly protein FimT
MLVALAIFLVLSTLTLSAFRGVSQEDRISAAAEQVKGWCEHARSLAIRDAQSRGIRFLPDPNNPRLCSSAAYIGATGYDEGTSDPLTPVVSRKAVLLAALAIRPSVTVVSPQPGTATPGEWGSLLASGALSDEAVFSAGIRIELPRGSGRWYSVSYVGDRDRNGNGSLDPGIPEDFNANGLLETGFLVIEQPIPNRTPLLGRPLDYRLELGPTVLSDEPSPLPRGTVIDLDASILPAAWRPAVPAAGAPAPGYPQVMDLMFSPQGAFTGRGAAAAGVVHLCVSTVEDAEKSRSLDAAPLIHPVNVDVSDLPLTESMYPFVLADPATPQRIVSLFASSGRVASANVFLAPAWYTVPGKQQSRAGTAALGFMDCYTYALRGQEAP